MDQNKVDRLKEQLATLRRELESLTSQAGGFPALERNAARISANLSMMEISLGLENAALKAD